VGRAGIHETGAIGSSAPTYIGKGPSANIVTDNFRHDYLPDPTEKRARLALAFYREGMSTGTVATRVLNFFKILNILFSDPKSQVDWINANLSNLRNHRELKRLGELRSTKSDIGQYLYGSGRCAVAHAFSDPLVDPENSDDLRRLQSDLPLIQALAELAIEKEFGLKSRETVWREHLYQLEGFRTHLGEDIVSRLKSGKMVDVSEIPVFGRITVGVRDQCTIDSFVGLNPQVVDVREGVVWLRCDSLSGIVQILLGLDIKEEYLRFDPEAHVAVSANATAEALKAQQHYLLLLKTLLLNGQLEVIDTDTGYLLGRTDAYIGTNIDMQATLANLEKMIDELDRRLIQLMKNDA
jgi:hypothetical protein